MKNVMYGLGLTMLAFLASTAILGAQPAGDEAIQEQNIDTYVELLRQDIRQQKTAMISVMMNLSAEQASAFWPVYRQYEQELAALGDEKLAALKDYADNYGALSGEKATELARRVLNHETKRNELKRKYIKELSEALSPILALRFLQVENQILHLLDLQIASNLPVVQ